MTTRSKHAIILIGILATALGSGCASRKSSFDQAMTARTAEEIAFEQGAKRPPSIKTRFLYARLLAAQGHHEQAAAVLSDILTERPDLAGASLELASIQFEQGYKRRAAQTLSRAIERNPQDPVLLNNMGVCLVALNRYEDGLEFFSRAAAIIPDDPRYRGNVAMALGLLGRYDEALAVYRQVVDPGLAHYNTALLAEANANESRARTEYEQALRHDQTLPPLRAEDEPAAPRESDDYHEIRDDAADQTGDAAAPAPSLGEVSDSPG